MEQNDLSSSPHHCPLRSTQGFKNLQQLQGEIRPLTPTTRGAAPGPRLELCPPGPRYRLALPAVELFYALKAEAILTQRIALG